MSHPYYSNFCLYEKLQLPTFPLLIFNYLCSVCVVAQPPNNYHKYHQQIRVPSPRRPMLDVHNSLPLLLSNSLSLSPFFYFSFLSLSLSLSPNWICVPIYVIDCRSNFPVHMFISHSVWTREHICNHIPLTLHKISLLRCMMPLSL